MLKIGIQSGFSLKNYIEKAKIYEKIGLFLTKSFRIILLFLSKKKNREQFIFFELFSKKNCKKIKFFYKFFFYFLKKISKNFFRNFSEIFSKFFSKKSKIKNSIFQLKFAFKIALIKTLSNSFVFSSIFFKFFNTISSRNLFFIFRLFQYKITFSSLHFVKIQYIFPN